MIQRSFIQINNYLDLCENDNKKIWAISYLVDVANQCVQNKRKNINIRKDNFERFSQMEFSEFLSICNFFEFDGIIKINNFEKNCFIIFNNITICFFGEDHV